MVKEPSRTWKYFLSNFFGDQYMMWHEGFDPKAISDLTGDERIAAEDMLIAHPKDQWSAYGLAAIKSKKAILTLKKAIHEERGIVQLRSAVALEKIEENQEQIAVIIDILFYDPSPYTRLEAARELRSFNYPHVIESLFQAILDPDYLVRYHTCNSLLYLHNFEKEINEFPEIFANIIENKKKSKKKSIKNPQIAVDQLKALLKTKEKKL